MLLPKSPTYALSSGWWWGEDSNLRRLRRQIYSLFPLAAREPHLIVDDRFGPHRMDEPKTVFKYGASEGTRTPGLLITNQLLYQLSYAGLTT